MGLFSRKKKQDVAPVEDYSQPHASEDYSCHDERERQRAQRGGGHGGSGKQHRQRAYEEPEPEDMGMPPPPPPEDSRVERPWKKEPSREGGERSRGGQYQEDSYGSSSRGHGARDAGGRRQGGHGGSSREPLGRAARQQSQALSEAMEMAKTMSGQPGDGWHDSRSGSSFDDGGARPARRSRHGSASSRNSFGPTYEEPEQAPRADPRGEQHRQQPPPCPYGSACRETSAKHFIEYNHVKPEAAAARSAAPVPLALADRPEEAQAYLRGDHQSQDRERGRPQRGSYSSQGGSSQGFGAHDLPLRETQRSQGDPYGGGGGGGGGNSQQLALTVDMDKARAYDDRSGPQSGHQPPSRGSSGRRVRHPGLGAPDGHAPPGDRTPGGNALVLHEPRADPRGEAYGQSSDPRTRGVSSVHTRQASSSAPKQPNRPRPAFVRKRGGSIRQSFVGDAMHMTAAEASNLARQVQRERAEHHVRGDREGAARQVGQRDNRGGEELPGGMPSSGGGGGRAEEGAPEPMVLRQMLDDIRRQCKALEQKLQEQKRKKQDDDAARRKDKEKLEESERKMWQGAQEASNAWGLLAKDRELHKDEVMKLTAIIRKYDTDARQMKTQGGSSEASLVLERAEKEEMRQRASHLEKEVANKMISLDKAEAAAEIAATRRLEAESEKERAIELLEKKAGDVKESRARVAELETKLSQAEGGEELTRASASLTNMETQYVSQKRMNAEKATIISELERETARLKDELATAEDRSSNAAQARKDRDSGIMEEAGEMSVKLGEVSASLKLKEQELVMLREQGLGATAARDAAQGELAKLKAVVNAQALSAEQRQASAARESQSHAELLKEVEVLRTEVKVHEKAANSALLQSAARGSNADAAKVAAAAAAIELEKIRLVVGEKANLAATAAQEKMLADQGKDEAERLSAALRGELQTAQASLLELRSEMAAKVQNLTASVSAASQQGSASEQQMSKLTADLEKARVALSAAAEASLSKDAEVAALSRELGAGNAAKQKAEEAAAAAVVAATTKTSELTGAMASVEAEKAALASQLAQLQSALQSGTAATVGVQSELAAANEGARVAKEQSRKITEELEASKRELGASERKAEAATASVTSLEAAVGNAKAAADGAAAEMSSKEAKAKASQEELAASLAEAEGRLAKGASSASEETQRLTVKLAEVEARQKAAVADAEERASKAAAEVVAAKAECARLAVAVTAAERTAGAEGAEAAARAKEKAALQAELAAALAEAEVANQEKNETGRTLTKAQGQADSLKQELTAAMAKTAEITQAKTELEAQLGGLKSAAASGEGAAEAMRGQLEAELVASKAAVARAEERVGVAEESRKVAVEEAALVAEAAAVRLDAVEDVQRAASREGKRSADAAAEAAAELDRLKARLAEADGRATKAESLAGSAQAAHMALVEQHGQLLSATQRKEEALVEEVGELKSQLNSTASSQGEEVTRLSAKLAEKEEKAKALQTEHEAVLARLAAEKTAVEDSGAKGLAKQKEEFRKVTAEVEKRLEGEVAATAAARKEVAAREDELAAAKQAASAASAAAERAAGLAATEKAGSENSAKSGLEEAARKLRDAESAAATLRTELEAAVKAKGVAEAQAAQLLAKEKAASEEVMVAKQAGAAGIQETSERANRLEQELAVAKTAAQTASATAEAAKASAAAAEQSRTALASEMATLLSTKTELEASAQAREGSRAAEQKMMSELREKLVSYESAAMSSESTASQAAAALQAEVSSTLQAHKLLQGNLQRAEESSSKAEADAAQARQTAEAARAEAAAVQTQLSAAEEAKAAASAELATLRAQSVATAGSAEGERAKVSQLQHELEVAKTEAETRQQTSETALAAAHADADKARARARELEEAVRATKASVESATAEAGGEVTGLKDSLAAKTAQCDSLHSQLQTLNVEHRTLEEKLSETEMATLNSKDARVKQLQDKYDELSAQCREAESRCQQAETALSSAEQGSSSATTRLQGELERNAQLLVMAQNDVAELRTTKLELETELDGARAAAKDAVHTAKAQLQGELAQVGAQRAALESQLGKATEAQGSIFELLQEYRKCRYGDEDDDGEVKEPPTKEEVHEYAAYLNFDLSLNPQLEWLAAEAIDAPLPMEWQEFEDEKENQFFFNSITQTSSYEHPYDALYQKLYRALSR